jgi:hypothetical protein
LSVTLREWPSCKLAHESSRYPQGADITGKQVLDRIAAMLKRMEQGGDKATDKVTDKEPS